MKSINEGEGTKNFYWNDFVLRSVETFFLEVGAYVSLKKEPPQVSDRVVFIELSENMIVFEVY